MPAKLNRPKQHVLLAQTRKLVLPDLNINTIFFFIKILVKYMEKKSSTLKKNELIAVKLHKELVRYVFVQFHFFHMVVMQQFKKVL